MNFNEIKDLRECAGPQLSVNPDAPAGDAATARASQRFALSANPDSRDARVRRPA